MRNIGDDVYIPHFTTNESYRVTCPDCGGTGQVTVIFHDGHQISIECGNCRNGFDLPTGQVTIYKKKVGAKKGKIIGIAKKENGEIEYTVEHVESGVHNIVPPSSIFDDEEAATIRAQELSDKYEQDQLDKIKTKEKPTHSWASNASYHKKAIKKAEQDVAYHTAKLNVAKLKAKEPGQ